MDSLSYRVPVCSPLEDDPDWYLMDYTLNRALGVANNIEAEEVVKNAFNGSDLADTIGEVVFDSEMGCFFAYVKEQEAAELLSEFIGTLVASGPNANATPGTMLDSPAYFNTQNFS